MADLVKGDKLPTRVYTVTRDVLIRYAGASGDFNPIHWSDRSARAVGLQGVIAHGMYTMALAARAVAEWVPPTARVVELTVKFANPVLVPDDDTGVEVTLGGTVRDESGGRVTLDLSATVGGEKVLVQARAVVDLG